MKQDFLSYYEAALADYRIHWVNWGLGGLPGYAGMSGKLRSDGRDLDEAIAAEPELFRGESPPMLDLSHQDTLLDRFIDSGPFAQFLGHLDRPFVAGRPPLMFPVPPPTLGDVLR